MPIKKKKNNKQIVEARKYIQRFRRARAFTILNIALLILNCISYFFVSSYSVSKSQAKDILYCMKICEAGSLSCNFGTCANAPSATTGVASNITSTTATVSGTVASDGGDAIIERGVVLATHGNPTILDSKYTKTGTTGDFSINITGLSANTTYYMRAYAENSVGVSYGNVISFTTLNIEAEPTPTPTPTPSSATVSGPAGAIPFSLLEKPFGLLTDEERRRSLVFGESDVSPYIQFTKIIADNGGRVFIPVQNIALPYIDTLYEFTGKTNIKNAFIYISLTSPNTIFATTLADEHGNWTWVSPEILLYGNHSLTVFAMSPSNASVRETNTLYFIIISPELSQGIPLPAPTPITSQLPKSEILPPVALPPIEISKDVYMLDTNIAIQEIVPGAKLDVKTFIKSFDPSISGEIALQYTITDSMGAVVYTEGQKVIIKDSTIIEKSFYLNENIQPGNYVLIVEFESKGKKYITTEPFTVNAKTFIQLPGSISITQEGAQKGLMAGSLAILCILIFFIISLWQEYKKARNAVQITGLNLWADKEII